MDPRAEIREFLATRRAKITPGQAGMRLYGGRRRVPGLRREEAAMLAGVSIGYYTRLEKGNVAGVSHEVLGAVARALQLDQAERAHLFGLARAARPRRPTARPRGTPPVAASVQHILDAAATAAAFARNGRLDLLAANAHALYPPLHAGPAGEPGPVLFPGPPLAGALPRLGRRREHHGRAAAHRSRPRPAGPRPARPRRGTRHHQPEIGRAHV